METQSVNYGERVDLRRVNLLALVLNFEKYWQSYSLSDGILYATEVREEAQKIIPLFYEIYGKKKASAISSNETVYVDEIRDFIKELERWLSKGTTFPKRVAGREYTSRSNFMFQYLFIIFEDQLQSEIGLPIRMELSATPHEDYFRRKQMKWAGQIPEDLVERAMDPDFIDRMSRADTLVMVADIRRSQDLITYGSTTFYRERIMGFLDKVRKILREDYGIYDRFTGDGFIAYFNQFVCEQEGRDYYEMALDACHRIQSFSQQYFDENGVKKDFRSNALLLRALLSRIKIGENWFGYSKEFWLTSLLNSNYQSAVHYLLTTDELVIDGACEQDWIKHKDLLKEQKKET